MLGNWSFGDYFKEQSIAWGWELSTEGFGFDPELIWVSVFEGDEELGLGPDAEAIEIWRSIGVPEERIVALPRSENFWQGGDTGPCGPCSEMYLDRGPAFGRPDDRPGDDTDRYLEYWNHVFMTYDLAADGSLSELPMKSIDTGMGLERMAAVLQGVESVFDVDSLRPIVDLAEKLSGRSYTQDAPTTRAMRILADHSRGAAAMIADGVVPSNEERGYVLRRILRRAIHRGRSLGLEAPFMEKFAGEAVDILGLAYPELEAERDTVMRWVNDEEESFGRTLDRGMQMVAGPDPACPRGPDVLDRRGGRVQAPRHLRLPLRPHQGAAGRGGPLRRRRGLRGADGGAAHPRPDGDRDRPWIRGPSRRRPQLRLGGTALALRRLREAAGRDQLARDSGRQRQGARQTRGESLLRRGRRPGRRRGRGPLGGGSARVADVYRIGEDQAVELDGPSDGLEAGGRVEAEVDHVARFATMRNHTATHLLHAALRERLGTHVRQAGSSVRPDKLRFDFTHGAPLTSDELRDVGDRVNDWIKESHFVRALEMSRMDAERLGAMALFGEKYGDWVRVVEVEDVSRELCGGTHVPNTAEIGIFAIASEGSSAANVRRIEALTGPAAIDWFRSRSRSLSEIGRIVGSAQDPVAGARRLAERLEELEKQSRRRPARPISPRGPRRWPPPDRGSAV